MEFRRGLLLYYCYYNTCIIKLPLVFDASSVIFFDGRKFSIISHLKKDICGKNSEPERSRAKITQEDENPRKLEENGK
jgi:hypothetical protein